jgi:hypothetical protein
MASGIPKRATNTHKKETRKASWERTQKKKEARRTEQAQREAANKKLGVTAKQRYTEKIPNGETDG